MKLQTQTMQISGMLIFLASFSDSVVDNNENILVQKSYKEFRLGKMEF